MSEHIRISAADQIHLTEYINEHYNSEAQAMQMASGEQISITWRVPSAKGDCKYCGPINVFHTFLRMELGLLNVIANTIRRITTQIYKENAEFVHVLDLTAIIHVNAGERIKAGRSAEMTFSSLAPPEDPDKALPGSNPRAIQGKSSPSSGAESGDSSYDPSVSAYSLLMAPHQLGGGGRMITGGKAASGAGRGAGRAIAAPKTYGKKKY
ncbi:MAG: hypothetical protein EZS28_007998 [Streblomastix strix]|uniref:Uncharacterized protein n=1 Tax=Streblomastix strix TaxID=222440 RepID=A0A5J4WNR7_9EUKA|nr:MAG: hypothetical protein EZS28_007998 [Streblomastix strix]